jgi:two-component system OmpR family response regulator
MTKLKILYVEDEPDIRSIAKMAMQSLGGFDICECSSGAQALETAESFAPQLILLDVMMPGMNGPETLQKLRQLPVTAKTPAVFMTAKVQANEVAEYLSMGAVSVIPKPFDPMTLPQQIEDIWKKHGTTNAA